MGGLPIPSPIPLPNLQRLYFRILEPIDTAELGLDPKDAEAWQRLYNAVRDDGALLCFRGGGHRGVRGGGYGEGLRRNEIAVGMTAALCF